MSTWFFAVSVAALIAVVILLAWRVWRLEVASGRLISRREWAEERCKDWEQASRNRKQGLDELARALGYEWKRTDAKEGWEKKSPFGFGDLYAYRKALYDYVSPREYDWALSTTNRRKADRRKPTPQAAPKSPPKKPRRAH